MRVLHLHRIRGISGSERHLLTLLPALRDRGVDARFLGLDDPRGEPDAFYRELETAGVPAARVGAPHDISPRLAAGVARATRRESVDLVHTHLVHADVYGAIGAAAARLPLVSTKHNDDPFRAGAFRYVERAVTRRVARVVAITTALARFNIERVGIPASKVEVVPYGLDEPPPATGAVLPVPDGAAVLLSVGRLVPQKGHETAVRALALLDRPDAVLAILGEGPERAGLESLARELGVAERVLLPGNAGTVGDWMRRADVFVHPARWEGFGLVLLEAMLCGLPVVASRVSAIPEIVVDGETGSLVDAGDAEAFARALGRLLDDERTRGEMGAAGRARAQAEFSVARMADETVALYERVAGARRAA